MGPFFRVIKLSLRYKWAIVASAANALLIGVLWGVSITTVYPFVEVVLRGETVSTWLDGQIDKARAGVERSRVEIEKFQEQLDKDPSGASGLKQSKLIVLRSRHAAEEKALGYFEWLRPSLQGRVPSTPFATLAVVMVFLVLATMLKGLCLVLNTLLVSRVADRTVMDMRRDFYRAALTMDQKTLDKHGTASLMSQIVHNTQLVGEGLRTLYGTSVREPLKMLACLVIAGMISWQLLLLSLLVAPLGGALIHYLSHRTKRIALHECAGFATMLETILETLNGIKIVRIYNHERGERRRFKKDSSALYHAGRRIALSDALVKPITELTASSPSCWRFWWARTWCSMSRLISWAFAFAAGRSPPAPCLCSTRCWPGWPIRRGRWATSIRSWSVPRRPVRPYSPSSMSNRRSRRRRTPNRSPCIPRRSASTTYASPMSRAAGPSTA